MNSARKSYRHLDEKSIPTKANRVLNIILIAMLLIILRIWHLAVIQYDEKLDESRKPQRRVVVEPAKRATIRDRFNIPLAINKIQYNIAIIYSQIKHIPTVVWETSTDQKRKKRAVRKEYILKLSQILAKELDLDAERIEDLIYAKAAFYHQIPFVIKEDISEEQYYRLKMLEKDWLGIQVQKVPKRHYPLGKVGGDLIGYMGAINRQEYETIIHEINALQEFVASYENGEEPTPLQGFSQGLTSIEQVRRRLKETQEMAYSINDYIGKTGVEGRFENILRGFQGKKSFYSDAKGNFLRELPGTRSPLSGKRVLLTISSELQEYAEQLLVQNETIRQTRLSHLQGVKHTILALKQPWIKGGAIVAMDPRNGEILAMASLPRFDPNDFISSGNAELNGKKYSNVQKWLESEAHLAEIWNQQRSLEKESFDDRKGEFKTEKLQMTWENFLNRILSKESPLKNTLLFHGTLKEAHELQTNVDKILEMIKQDPYFTFNFLYSGDPYTPHGKKLRTGDKETLEKHIDMDQVGAYKTLIDKYLRDLTAIYDQVLLIDLIKVAMRSDLFSPELLEFVGDQKIGEYREANSSMALINNVVKKMAKTLFHDIEFKKWREENEKEYLKQKRIQEKASNRPAKPYIDYLDQLENEMFETFWSTYKWHFFIEFLSPKKIIFTNSSHLKEYLAHFKHWQKEISQGAHNEIEWRKAHENLSNIITQLPNNLAIEYLQTFRSYNELDRKLLGKYRYLRKDADGTQKEKHLAAAFYPKFGFGYGRSQAYRQATTQGSLFKMVTAYEALVQKYNKSKSKNNEHADINPLTMVDTVFQRGKDVYLGYGPDGLPLPRHYKGGRLPKSSHPSGNVDLLKAIETSSNPYFALLAGDIIESPKDLVRAAKLFSFGSKTGVELPGEIAGKVPDDVETNKTGLYSFSIGQHTLVVTPLQTSVMLSTLANGGKVFKPKIVSMLAGKDPQRRKELNPENTPFPYRQELARIGIDFPLFIDANKTGENNLVKHIPTEIKEEIFLPKQIHKMLLDGMCRVVNRSHGESLNGLSRLYSSHPEAISDYLEMKHQLIGKTSTAESVENIDLDLFQGTNLYTHVWFGGISYEQDILEDSRKQGTYLFKDSLGSPELVVVVYLRYGGYGKEAAPLAAQVVKKWREIKQKAQLQTGNK